MVLFPALIPIPTFTSFANQQTGSSAPKKAKKAPTATTTTEKKEPKKDKFERSEGNLQPRPAPPNKILFVENLPDQVNEMMLSMLFQQYVISPLLTSLIAPPGVCNNVHLYALCVTVRSCMRFNELVRAF